MEELKLLDYIVKYMEKNGIKSNSTRVSLDEQLINEMNEDYSTDYSEDDLRKIFDKCFAYDYLTHTSAGSKYSDIQITTKGVGVVISKRITEEKKNSRSTLKILSDTIEEHKGLTQFILIPCAIIGLIYTISRLF